MDSKSSGEIDRVEQRSQITLALTGNPALDLEVSPWRLGISTYLCLGLL